MFINISRLSKVSVRLLLFVALTGQPVFAGGDIATGILTHIEFGESSVALLVETVGEASFNFASASLDKYNLCGNILILLEQEAGAANFLIEKIERQLVSGFVETNVHIGLEFLASNTSYVETGSHCSLYAHISEDSFLFDENQHLVLSLGFPND